MEKCRSLHIILNMCSILTFLIILSICLKNMLKRVLNHPLSTKEYLRSAKKWYVNIKII